MTPAGIETATFRFVAQHLSHCATAALQYLAVCVGLLWILHLTLYLIIIPVTHKCRGQINGFRCVSVCFEDK